MPSARRRISLSQAASQFLTDQLKAIARSSPFALRRRADRVALTFRPHKKGRDAIPDHPIPIEDFRMLAAYHRPFDGPRRGPRWRVALGSYRAELDFPGSGRIVFRGEQAWDLSHSNTLLNPRPNYTAIRAAILLHQAIQDADAPDLARAVRWPEFSFGFEPGRPPRFDPIDLPDAHATERIIDGLRAWPATLFFRDGRTTLDRRPCQVFASLAHLKGRSIRNPAFAELQTHGLLPAGISYKAWLSTISRANHRGRVIQDPRAEGTETAQIRQGIEAYLLADPSREPRLLAGLAEACQAVGIKLADGPEGVDALAELVDNPWSRPTIPYAARIQTLKLTGPAGPSTLSFTDAVADVNLFDLATDRDQPRPDSSGVTRRPAGRVILS